jgi:uncharacterized protein (TIGR02118 family)
MHKLVILFEQPDDWGSFQPGWQEFMALAEQMPALQKEVVSDIDQIISAPDARQYFKMHELHFEDRAALDAALQSEAGQTAGKWLHQFCSGHFVLMIADHREASPEDFKK